MATYEETKNEVKMANTRSESAKMAHTLSLAGFPWSSRQSLQTWKGLLMNGLQGASTFLKETVHFVAVDSQKTNRSAMEHT
jgi:hypothetical protein